MIAEDDIKKKLKKQKQTLLPIPEKLEDLGNRPEALKSLTYIFFNYKFNFRKNFK